MLDDMACSLENLVWLENTKCESYDRLELEFLSLLNVDWVDFYKDKEVLIAFRIFNKNAKLSLRNFYDFFTSSSMIKPIGMCLKIKNPTSTG